MKPDTQLDLVVLGNLIVDDIVYEDGRTRMAQPGGATLYMGLTAHLWNLRIGLVSVAGRDFPRQALDQLASHGVALEGVRQTDDPGLRTWLLYEGHLRRVVHRLDGATHDRASPRVHDIPESWRTRAIHLAPMPLDLQTEQVTQVRSRSGDLELLSLDPFELLTGRDLEPWHRLLAGVDLLLLSEDEIPDAEARASPEGLLRPLLRDRLDTILFKQADRGGLALQSSTDATLRWPARAETVTDTTGAGDAFACGVLAGLLQGRSLERSIQWGVVSASFVIQGQGAESLVRATPEMAQRRLSYWFGS